MQAAIQPIARKLWLAAALLLALWSGAVPASAQEIAFPPLTGRVVDDANLLDPSAKSSLTAKLAELEAKTTDQFVIVTVRSLQGRTIEEYGYRLGRAWGIGQAGKNNGVLLIVAPNEHKVRIEVGYGLEGALPDAITSTIIRNIILPRFKANDYPGGIANGADLIIKVLRGEAKEWAQEVTSTKPTSSTPSTLFGFIGLVAPFLFSGPGLILLLIFLHFFYVALVKFFIWMHWMKRRPVSWNWGSSSGGSSSGGSWSSGSSSSGGGFSGGGGSFGGGGSSGSW